MGYRIRMRTLCVLLAAALATFAPIGGFGSDGTAHANANLSQNGLIRLDYIELYGDEIRIDWTITYTYSYQQSAELYRLPDMSTITIEYGELDTIGGSLAKRLEPGAYLLEITLKDMGGVNVLDTYIHEFVMPDPVTRLVHVFGTEEPIEGLKFWPTFPESEKALTATEIPNPGKGYVTYAVDILPNGCFTMESDNYYFSVGKALCANEAREFIVQASDDTDDLVRLDTFFAYEDEEEGILAGSLILGYKDIWAEFKMNLYDRKGNAHACEMYGEVGFIFECELPDDPDFLQVDKVVQGDSIPTNVVIPMADINLPGEITVVDGDRHIDRIDPLIGFENVPNDIEFAFYKITTTQDHYWPSGIRYIPVEEGSYSLELENIEADEFSNRNVAIQLVDTDGNLYAKTAVFPLIDKMSEQVTRIEYEVDYNMEALNESYSPDDASFRDDDLTEGVRAGKVTWSLPEIGEYELMAYDLYFHSDTDPDQDKIQGEARAYVIHGLTDTFEYALEDVPEWAAYLEVVPLIRDMVQWRDYYGNSFSIPLNDRITPLLDELKVDGDPVYPQQSGSSYYEYVAEWNADVVDVTATSMNGVVYIGDEGPAESVTAAVYLDGPVTSVPILVKTPEGDWSSEYELVITKELAPDVPRLASLAVNGNSLAVTGTYHELIVPYGTGSVPVIATADSGVRITLNGNEHYGTAEEDVPVVGDDFSFTIVLYELSTELTSEYTVRIRRMTPAVLANDVRFGRLVGGGDGFGYRFVTKGLTAGELKDRFVTDSGVSIEFRHAGGQAVADWQEVPSGAAVYLSRETEFQAIRLRWLSDDLRSELGIGESAPIQLLFVVRNWSDVTGDNVFDQKDVRLLLHVIE